MPSIITRGAVSALAYGWTRITAVLDPYFKYVTMLLPGNGTNGAQNNTFLDSSTNNFSITRNGNTTQGTFTPYGSNWSYNSGSTSTDYLTTASNAAFAFGTGDFTMEAFVFATASQTDNWIIGLANNCWLRIGSAGKIEFYDSVASASILSSAAMSTNQWVHVAAVRSGTTLTLYQNGTSVGSGTVSTNFSTSVACTIGNQVGFDRRWNGYISNARVVKGTAVYTSSFTPSTTPLTAISGTSLLTCQSNRFIDNSTNAFTLTVSGSPSVQRFSPFSPSAAYSTTTIGGSGYFDGSGDYLSVANNAALNVLGSSFTIECWFYLTAAQGNYGLVSKHDGSGGYLIRLDTTIIRFFTSAATVDRTYTFSQGTWYHVAVVSNGTTGTLYVNGVAQGATFTTNGTNATTALQIGRTNTITNDFPGYISDVRITNTVVYSGAFTPPTAPLTAVSGTALLCNNTNAGIIDNAMMNDLETVGNAQISTTQSKFGGSSIYFDGTGDWLQAPPNPGYDLGSGDFTIEMWLNPSSTTNTDAVISKGVVGSTGNEVWTLQWNATNNLAFFSGGGLGTAVVTSTTAFSTGTWYFVALTRASGTTRIFVNGTLEASSSTSYTVTSGGSLYVGAGWYAPSSRDTSCYIDDLRITKGYARYTANFTAPTAAFPTQ